MAPRDGDGGDDAAAAAARAAAAALYARAIAADPLAAEPHVNLGNLRLSEGDVGGALASLEVRGRIGLEMTFLTRSVSLNHCRVTFDLQREPRGWRARSELHSPRGAFLPPSDDSQRSKKKSDGAVPKTEAAVALAPGLAAALFNLGVALEHVEVGAVERP